MSRYIDADALLEKVQFRVRINDDTDKTIKRCVEITRNLIKNAPTADVEPVVHGRWDLIIDKGISYHQCSVCGFYPNYGIVLHSNYCPNCGCRMEGEEGELDGTKS